MNPPTGGPTLDEEIDLTATDLAASTLTSSDKFDALVTPVLGQRGEALFGLAREFGRSSALAEMQAILARL